MDIVTLHLLEPDRKLSLGFMPIPNTLKNFFNNEKGAYEFTILIAADNAKPLRDIKVTFDFDPKADELTFNTVDATRFPR